MAEFDRDFVQGMQRKLEVELIGVAPIGGSSPPELTERARALLPGAQSVAVFGKEIYREVVALLRPSKVAGEAESGELLGVHCDYLNGRLTRAVHEMAGMLRGEGYRSVPLPAVIPTDQRFLTALLSFKHVAQAAGLGTIGRSGLLITPEFGPRVRLACVLTEAPLEPSPGNGKDYCVNCDACIRACPARALEIPTGDAPYAINKFACRAYRQAGLNCGVCMKVCDEVLA